MYLAIKSNKSKLCQLLSEMALTEVDNMECLINYDTLISLITKIGFAIDMAILHGRVEILRYLVSKSNEHNKTLCDFTGTALHSIAFFACRPSQCPCVEMLRIMMPKITNFDVQDGLGNETPLHLVLAQYHVRKSSECLEPKIKLLAPVTNLNIPDKRGMTALDYAQKDPDIHRIFSELNLL